MTNDAIEFNRGDWKQFTAKIEPLLKAGERAAFERLKAERTRDHAEGHINKMPTDADLWEELQENPHAFPDTKHGSPISSAQNVKLALLILQVKLSADEFSGDILVRGVPGAYRVDDDVLRFLRKSFERMGLFLSPSDLTERIAEIAVEDKVNTATAFFNECEKQWLEAGRPEPELLDEYLVRFAKAENTALTREIGANTLIACVIRNLLPGGYPYKYMAILEGGQDAGKSAFLRELAGAKFFGDGLVLGMDAARTMEATEGKFLIEAPELAGMSKQGANEMKAFMSRLTDRARRAWARTVSEAPRRFVLVGTTNQEKYLRDETGGVRYCPVAIKATDADPIDLAGLRKARIFIWGQAAHRAKALLQSAASGEYVLHFTQEARDAAKALQSDRFEGDDVHEVLQHALPNQEQAGSEPYLYVTPQTLKELVAAHPEVKVAAGRLTRTISGAMKQLGWLSKKVRRAGERSTITAYINCRLDGAVVDPHQELQISSKSCGDDDIKLVPAASLSSCANKAA
jgi:hypothetical protein